MKRNLLIIAPMTTGGISAVVGNLMKGNLDEYYNVYIHETNFGSLGLKKIFENIWQIILAFYLLAKVKPWIVHIHSSTEGGFYRKSIYVLISKLFSNKIIFHIHPCQFTEFLNNAKTINQKYILMILSMVDAIIVLANSVADNLAKFKCLKNKHIRILRNPICLDEYDYHPAENRDRSSFLYLGWIVEKKGVYDLLQAAQKVKEKYKDFQLVYCGDKEVMKLRNMVVERKLSSYVEVRDWIDQKEKNEMLSKFTGLILPSYTEGIPNVILEAMASGISIVTTPVGGIPEILEDKKNCLFMTPGNIDEMAEKIERLLKDRPLQCKMSENNIRDIQKYDSKNIVSSLIEIYDLFE